MFVICVYTHIRYASTHHNKIHTFYFNSNNCIVAELISPIPYCIHIRTFPKASACRCYSAAISGPRDYRPRLLTCDNSLLCPRARTRSHTHTSSRIYLNIFCHLYCRDWFLLATLPQPAPYTPACLPRDNITWTQVMRLRSGPVTHPLLLSSSGMLLK